MDDWDAGRTVAEMAAAGAFGAGRGPVSFEPDADGPASGPADNFASAVQCGTATVGEGARRQRHRLVVKRKQRSAALRELYKNDAQFHNEKLFYERIAPFLLAAVPAAARAVRAPPLCRYLYGRNDCGRLAGRDVIVLENATAAHGYRMSDRRLHLDVDHLVVALNALAKFHALSYRAKHVDPTGFAEAIAGVKDTQWSEDGEFSFAVGADMLTALFAVALDRLAERRRARGADEDWRARRFRTDALADVKRTLRRATEPAEPVAVLCHGDYNRNNVMFLYDGDGRPADALPFDMATVRYGSPALDLSFFLYMNTDRSTRADHWDRLLDAYCAALAAALSDVAPAVRAPGRGLLDAEMRDRAFYGLAHVSFFARVMLADGADVDPDKFLDAGFDQMFSALLSFGGDAATDVVADAVQHFLDISYGAAPAGTR